MEELEARAKGVRWTISLYAFLNETSDRNRDNRMFVYEVVLHV